MKSITAMALAFFVLSSTSRAYADNPTREFVMSCTYGVMAGTLVGVASLAFTKKPSDNMYRVARGASLGLYTGILLGLYVVYIVPGLDGGDEEPTVKLDRLRFMISPTLNASNVPDGLKGDWTVLRF